MAFLDGIGKPYWERDEEMTRQNQLVKRDEEQKYPLINYPNHNQLFATGTENYILKFQTNAQQYWLSNDMARGLEEISSHWIDNCQEQTHFEAEIEITTGFIFKKKTRCRIKIDRW